MWARAKPTRPEYFDPVLCCVKADPRRFSFRLKLDLDQVQKFNHNISLIDSNGFESVRRILA